MNSATDSPPTLRDIYPGEAAKIIRQTVVENPYIPKVLNGFPFPSMPQAHFLTHPAREILYGGAAGGGKSAALLAAALQYVTVPKYSAILFRRTLTDLELADGLIPMSHEWLAGTDAKWDGSLYQWTFPSGAMVSFGYMKDSTSHYRYKGAPFQTIGFDELTSFPEENQYRFMFSRLRKPVGMNVPLRCRAGSNPGDVGHEWVRARFIDGANEDRGFIPARLEHNPGLDHASYEAMLDKLDPVTRAQMRHGDWTIRPEGNLFKRAWFEIVDAPAQVRGITRAWDLAASEPKHGTDPDYTAGCKVAMGMDGTAYVCDMIHLRVTPYDVEKVVEQTAALDGCDVKIRIEQEPGASGKSLIGHYQRKLSGYDCRGVPATGDKVTRANPASAACERGAVKLVRGNWVAGFLDELCAFPVVGHDDRVDAFVNAYMSEAAKPGVRIGGYAPVAVAG